MKSDSARQQGWVIRMLKTGMKRGQEMSCAAGEGCKEQRNGTKQETYTAGAQRWKRSVATGLQQDSIEGTGRVS